jgi:hypothetical protein
MRKDRFSGLWFSAAGVEESIWQVLQQLQPGHVRQGGEVDLGGDSKPEAAFTQ